MHPQLETDNKRLGASQRPLSCCSHSRVLVSYLGSHRPVCREFIEALDACHANSWAKWTGGCNQAKHDLNMCLRKERIERTTRNREDAKKRRQNTEQVWKELREE
ncbi:hypothetical protein DAEQUDRAFT_676864 [Daedalea quercina L-15889]|uniref:COX assembly mitochondrial protein n=1 Tax=Daedalea quercina L-15889 TaxID=1314783 RepID=A0A165MBA3_9APHY|nr:hypothetical protein DAEQUDRAFT_676864 [Daedalea quercina L-15889]